MNMSQFEPLDDATMKSLLHLLLMPEKDIEDMYKECRKDGIVQILEKRIKHCNLETMKDANKFNVALNNTTIKFDPRAIIFLSLLSKGNPGKAIIALIETLEKADELKNSDITLDFLCTYVYPMGFYTDESFGKVWDMKKENKTGKYDFII